MMDYDIRLNTYLSSLYDDEKDELYDIEKYALNNNIPIIKKVSRNLLRTILLLKKPTQILEIGTAIGFSAILMSKILPDAKIITIENYPKRIEIAISNFKKYGFDNIKLHQGDAIEFLKSDNKKYDFIFLDCAKAQYITLLPDILRLLNKNGIIFADNVMQDDTILESKFAICRRDRTIHKRMREYLYAVTHNASLKSTIIPVDDGVCISIKM